MGTAGPWGITTVVVGRCRFAIIAAVMGSAGLGDRIPFNKLNAFVRGVTAVPPAVIGGRPGVGMLWSCHCISSVSTDLW